MNYLVQFLILLNPFALFIYLNSLYNDLGRKDFSIVLFKASLISGGFYLFFAFTGDYIFINFFNVRFDSFRLFGGIVILIYSLIFIIQGKKSFFTLKGSLDDLASEIALPFMVGAASVAHSILIGQIYNKFLTFSIITATMVINFITILLLIEIKYRLIKKKYRITFDKFLTILLRINGFFVGSIGIEMILKSIEKTFK
jgi:multiple antibiotic resistance protein